MSNELNNLLLPIGRDILNAVTNSVPRNRTTPTPIRGRTMFPIDIVNEEKTIYIYAELPGIDKDKINVDIYNNKLTIVATRTKPYENPEVEEIKFGYMERTLTIPICVTKKETVSVSITNGILKITINKLIEEENKFSVKPN